MFGTGLDGYTLIAWGLTIFAVCVTPFLPPSVGRIQRAEPSQEDGGYRWLVVLFFGMQALGLYFSYVALAGTFTTHELRNILLVVSLVSLVMFAGIVLRAFRRHREHDIHLETYMWIEAWAIIALAAWVWRSLL